MNWHRHGTAIFGHDVVAAIDAVKHPASRFESFDDVCAIHFENDISIMDYGTPRDCLSRCRVHPPSEHRPGPRQHRWQKIIPNIVTDPVSPGSPLPQQLAVRLTFIANVVRKEARHLASTDRRLFDQPFTAKLAISSLAPLRVMPPPYVLDL